MSYLLTTYHWPLLSRPQVAGFKCPVTYSNCLTPNDTLGRLIWVRIKELDPEALIIEEDKPCYWESSGNSVSEIRLPKTAAQFRFNREVLPRLYDYLDQLG